MTKAIAGGPNVPPQVSVIIPAYRFDPYVDEAIESVIAQTHRDFELIVVNDGSKNRDGVERVRGRFGDCLEMVTRENGGPGAARAVGSGANHGGALRQRLLRRGDRHPHRRCRRLS